MSFRQVTIRDGITVIVGTENESRVVDLLETLKKSVKLSNDGRLSDSTPVIWEGEKCKLGDLSQNEKMCLERNADGVLEGGYPI